LQRGRGDGRGERHLRTKEGQNIILTSELKEGKKKGVKLGKGGKNTKISGIFWLYLPCINSRPKAKNDGEKKW